MPLQIVQVFLEKHLDLKLKNVKGSFVQIEKDGLAEFAVNKPEKSRQTSEEMDGSSRV